MASKTSFFNKTIFRDTLRRYWAVFAVYAFALIAAIPLDMTLLKGRSSMPVSFYATQLPLSLVICIPAGKVLFTHPFPLQGILCSAHRYLPH